MLRPTLFALAGIAVAAAGVTRAVARDAGRPDTLSRPVRHLSIVASNYAFEAPDTVPAGLTSVDLLNRGPDLHHAWLVRLAS